MIVKRWDIDAVMADGTPDVNLFEAEGGPLVHHQDYAALKTRFDIMAESLRIYIHAHRTGNSVPPHIEDRAVKALEE